MRYLIFLLVLLFACNKSEIVTECTREPVTTLVTGHFILEDDFLISTLDGIQPLSAANLTVGYSYGDALLYFESDELNYSIWRNHGIGIAGISTHGKFTVREYTDQHSEVQLEDELNEWIYENQDAPIYFKLNLEI